MLVRATTPTTPRSNLAGGGGRGFGHALEACIYSSTEWRQ